MEDEPLWYKDAVIYEAHVRAFYDSDADGIGDFQGLTEKLDYLQDLGITALWLMPFYPSPLRDDGYDVSDYTGIHSSYGTLRDFQRFLRQAHGRRIRVITEFILNHTSDQHPWFQRARRASPGSRWRNFYIWSDTPDRYQDTPVIFRDFEASNWTWDSVANAYYWHRFFGHQPDLNFDSGDVRRALYRVVDFWFKMGVDGLRLDAVPYLYEREGTICEHLPETHAFLKDLRRYVDQHYPNRMLLAEANAWAEEAAAYFGQGDECHMSFHFPLMPRLFMGLRMEDRFPVIDVYRETPPIPDSCQWALFLRNHDELTLAKLTDEERDYMYRAYAETTQARVNLGIRRRLAPLLGNQHRKIELMNGLLLSLPGTPIIYYGDELGMGDNVYLGDRNGVRTPMQWSSDRNAGFSVANSQRLYLPVIVDAEYHYEAVNVEAQQENAHSLLWWMKRLIALRKRYGALSRGALEFVPGDNPRVLAFIRRFRDEAVLVVANLSRFAQATEIDLSAFVGSVPVEVFGRNRFPAIDERPYRLTLGPHNFYWFSLERQRIETRLVREVGDRVPVVGLSPVGERLLGGGGEAALETWLPTYLRERHWFSGRGRTIQTVRVAENIPLARGGVSADSWLLLLRVEYVDGEPEYVLLPAAIARGDRTTWLAREIPQAIIAYLQPTAGGRAVLYESLWNPDTCWTLLRAVAGRHHFAGEAGELVGLPSASARELGALEDGALPPVVVAGEHRNGLVAFGERLVLKMFHRPEAGLHPEMELGTFLRERTSFRAIPRLLGHLEYRPRRGEVMTLAVLQEYTPHHGDAWTQAMDELGRYYEGVLAAGANQPPPQPDGSLLDMAQNGLADAGELMRPYLDRVRLLGQQTAELHRALATDSADVSFAAERFTPFARQSLYHSTRELAAQTIQLLGVRSALLPETARDEARMVLADENTILERIRVLLDPTLQGVRIRCHGDYQLQDLLYTGTDFVVIDFEGEPDRPLSERRLKRPPFRDVASLVWSVHSAAHQALAEGARGTLRPSDVALLEPWADHWFVMVSATLLGGYLSAMSDSGLLPPDPEGLRTLWEVCLLERAMAQLADLLHRAPEELRTALRAVRFAVNDGGMG